MDHVKKAEELFMSGCNCAQSVFAAFDDVTGMDKDEALRLSAPFGGGMAGMRDKCGALSGMFMALGELYGGYDVKDNARKSEFYKQLQMLAKEFEDKTGSMCCRELLGLVKGVNPPPAERTPEYYSARPCIKLVSIAAQLAEDFISEH